MNECMYVCMYVCMYECMTVSTGTYVRTYVFMELLVKIGGLSEVPNAKNGTRPWL